MKQDDRLTEKIQKLKIKTEDDLGKTKYDLTDKFTIRFRELDQELTDLYTR